MSEASKAAIEYGTLWYYGANGERKSAGPNEMKIKAHIDGARAFLGWARSKRVVCGDWQETVVTMEDLESYFAEESK